MMKAVERRAGEEDPMVDIEWEEGRREVRRKLQQSRTSHHTFKDTCSHLCNTFRGDGTRAGPAIGNSC
jgi:hypothetical protein